eukprot:366363-Chlamydomonas_euryale.AAC.8
MPEKVDTSIAVSHTCGAHVAEAASEVPDPVCEIHTVRGKCGIAEPATPAAAAAIHLRVQYVLYATCCVFVRTVRRRPQARTYRATLHADTNACMQAHTGSGSSTAPAAVLCYPGASSKSE